MYFKENYLFVSIFSALAVENAGLILVCFTKKYKESVACRTKAEYAYNLKKPIIPLKMDKEYRADGWYLETDRKSTRLNSSHT